MTYITRTRFEPFRDLLNLQDQVSRVFQDFGRGSDELLTSGTFVPPVDIYEDEHSVTLKLEIPGMNEKDIDIKLENNTLTVRGERNFEKEEKEENFHRIERRYGAFARSFTLPATVDAEDVEANYENGVLRIKLAKRAEAKAKQIKVGVGGSKTIEGGKGKAA
ncbi:MAG: Hsp20/alpha crystallin family protein [Acidobacteriales bacterium]|nr:Hsp20/alpha crystallin family protein [Terriglobales bacterium]